ncbi:MAG: DUF1579 domain-containing protein [Gemmatimonadetes bacterium]|nr:DUF1579 domain-containing protein [Gemmatimonadota bacterium]
MSDAQMQNALTQFVGDWDVQQEVWTEPGTDPTVYRGRSNCKAIADGRATLMVTEVPDANFKGIALMTWNDSTSQYDMAYVDTLSDQGILRMSGRPAGSATASKELQATFGKATQERVWTAGVGHGPSKGGPHLSATHCVIDEVLHAGSGIPSDSGGHEFDLKLVENRVSDDEWVLEFFVGGAEGGESLVQRNQFTRAG